MYGLIEFDGPFLDFYTRCNSKTYYYLMVVAKYDIPVLVHSNVYAKRLIWECEDRFQIENAPIFSIKNQADYLRQIKGTKYRNQKFIIDDPIALEKDWYLEKYYEPEEVRDLVLSCLSGN